MEKIVINISIKLLDTKNESWTHLNKNKLKKLDLIQIFSHGWVDPKMHTAMNFEFPTKIQGEDQNVFSKYLGELIVKIIAQSKLINNLRCNALRK